MKHLGFIAVMSIIIPFIVVTFFLVDKKDPPITIESSMSVRVKRADSGKVDTVNLEAYVVGVIAGEMPVSFNLEALKAQAVAARSYVLRRISNNRNYDVIDTTLNQVYLDSSELKERWKDKYANNIMKIQTAVIETKGQYISYNGEIADALFFSTSNGYTENSEDIFGVKEPYLRSVESMWDKETSPVFSDQKEYSLEEFYSLTGVEYNNSINIEVLKKTNTGRILQLKINGEGMTGSELAGKLKLRSNDFTITQKENDVTIKTLGFGHGVGMSQYGALGMAEKGYKYDQILKYYYKGVTIKRL